MKHITAVITLYVVTVGTVIGAVKLATPPARPICKVEMVEVTKTEGDLMWVEQVAMELCK